MMAMRYLRARKAEGFVSVIAAFSFIGIMIGVATLIIVMSVMNGFHIQLVDRIIGLNGHLNVYVAGRPIQNYPSLLKDVEQTAGVVSVAPVVEGRFWLFRVASLRGRLRGGLPKPISRKSRYCRLRSKRGLSVIFRGMLLPSATRWPSGSD